MTDIKIVISNEISKEKDIAEELKNKIEGVMTKNKDKLKLSSKVVIEKAANDRLYYITPFVCFFNKNKQCVFPYLKISSLSDEEIFDLLNKVFSKNNKNKSSIDDMDFNINKKDENKEYSGNNVKLDSKNKAVSAASLITECVHQSLGGSSEEDNKQLTNFIEF